MVKSIAVIGECKEEECKEKYEVRKFQLENLLKFS